MPTWCLIRDAWCCWYERSGEAGKVQLEFLRELGFGRGFEGGVAGSWGRVGG